MFELVLRAPQPLVERASDALIDELEALSVSVEDADAGTGDEHRQRVHGRVSACADRASLRGSECWSRPR